MDDATLLRRAIELSRVNMLAGVGGPFGAVIARDGRVLGEGWNQVTSSNDPTAHAEVVAIRTACRHLGDFRLTGATLYTSCEPCPMCLSAAYWARVSRIVYAGQRSDAAAAGFDDEFIYREIPAPPHARTIPAAQMLADEARAVFEEWTAKQDKIVY